MREPVKKVIDGEQYTFCQLPPKKSLKLLTRILKIIGAPIGAAIGTWDGAGPAEDVENILDREIDLGAVVRQLCDRLDENDVEYIVDMLLSQVLHAGKGEVSKVFDEHFGGRLTHLFKVIFAALEVEYADFFDGKFGDILRDIISGRLAQAQGQAQGQRQEAHGQVQGQAQGHAQVHGQVQATPQASPT